MRDDAGIYDLFPANGLSFGSTDSLLTGICLHSPNLYASSRRLRDFYVNYIAADDSNLQLELARKVVGQLQDPREQFFLLAMTSATAHELRHFHDLISSPFGIWMMLQEIRLSANLPHAMLAIHQESAVALPFADWAQLDERRHRIYARLTAGRRLALRPPDFIARVASNADAHYKQVQALYETKMPGWSVNTRQILEASALSQQLWVIDQALGPELAEFFRRMVDTLDTRGTYLDLRRALGIQKSVSSSLMNAICFFSLCGDWFADSPSELDLPAVRIAVLADALNGLSIPVPDDHCVTFLDVCARKLKIPTLGESLAQSVAKAAEASAKLAAEIAAALPGLPRSVVAYARLLHELSAAHQHMAQKIATNWQAYFNFPAYIKNFGGWVAAPRWMRSSGYFFHLGNETIDVDRKTGDWIPLLLTQPLPDDPQGRKFSPLLLSRHPTAGVQFFSVDACLHVGMDAFIGRTIWSSVLSTPPDRTLVMGYLRSKWPEKSLLLIDN